MDAGALVVLTSLIQSVRVPSGHDTPGPASERGEQVGTTPGEKRTEKEEKGPTRPRRSPEIRLAGGSADEAHPC